MAVGALLALVASFASAAPKLDLSVASDGSFTIALDGKEWLAGSEYAVDAATASSGEPTHVAARRARLHAPPVSAPPPTYLQSNCRSLRVIAT